MGDVITVNREALYKMLNAFCYGLPHVVALHDNLGSPDSPVALLMENFNLNLKYLQNNGKLKVVAK